MVVEETFPNDLVTTQPFWAHRLLFTEGQQGGQSQCELVSLPGMDPAIEEPEDDPPVVEAFWVEMEISTEALEVSSVGKTD